jgi:hypothetical protein
MHCFDYTTNFLLNHQAMVEQIRPITSTPSSVSTSPRSSLRSAPRPVLTFRTARVRHL